MPWASILVALWSGAAVALQAGPGGGARGGPGALRAVEEGAGAIFERLADDYVLVDPSGGTCCRNSDPATNVWN